MNMDENLFGLWSTGEGYQGHASDECMLFFPDGTGRLEIWNWHLCSAVGFTWSIPSPGKLEFRDSRALRLGGPDGKAVVEGPSSWSPGVVEYEISEQQRPRGIGQWMPELQVGHGDQAWLPMGLVKRSLKGHEFPRFSV